MARHKPLEIDREVLVLAEGKDDIACVRAILDHIGASPLVQTHACGGKDELAEAIVGLPAATGFGSLASLGVIRDSDADHAAAWAAVTDRLARAGLPVPANVGAVAEGVPRVRIWLFPGQDRNGTLETMLLDAVRDDPAMPCVDTMFDCAGGLRRHPEKARLQAWLSTREEPELSGNALRRGYFDLDAPALAPFVRFLWSLLPG